MNDHYYSKSPQARHERQHFAATIRGHTLRFITDAGVFAKRGIDYGSQLLIEHMDIPEQARVLDVGCGYGPLGLFAAKITDSAHVTMIDINERAIALAKENAALNQLAHVHIMQSDLYDRVTGSDFTVVVTNPPIRAGKSVVHTIYEGAAERLSAGGHLWVVIQKKQGAASTLQKLQQLFVAVEEVAKSKGYRIYKATKATEHS